MKSKMCIALVCAVLASFVLGAAGLVTFAQAEPAEGPGKDRLVGIFITTEYLDLFDLESYFEDNADKILSGGEISPSDSAPYQGKLFGTIVDDPYTDPETGETVTTKKYVFEGVEGISYFVAKYTDGASTYWGSGADSAISDGYTGFHTTDAGDSIELKGTIYVSTSKGSHTFYYNPVYQTAAGEVYLMSGQGMSHGGEFSAGMSSSHALKEEQTVTRDGKSETVSSDIEVSICFVDMPVSTSILQFGRDGSVVSREDHAAGELPSQITASPDAAYMVVETRMKSATGEETVTRELYQPEDESLFAFFCREDGICVKQYCGITWK